MKSVIMPLAVASLLLMAQPAAATEVAGAWRVTGKVAAFAFTLNCRFTTAGGRIAGVCVDASTSDARAPAGQSHVLTAGTVDGDAVSWTYRSSFLLSKFDVTYRGRLTGDRISGSIKAAGRDGVFTAVRIS